MAGVWRQREGCLSEHSSGPTCLAAGGVGGKVREEGWVGTGRNGRRGGGNTGCAELIESLRLQTCLSFLQSLFD